MTWFNWTLSAWPLTCWSLTVRKPTVIKIKQNWLKRWTFLRDITVAQSPDLESMLGCVITRRGPYPHGTGDFCSRRIEPNSVSFLYVVDGWASELTDKNINNIIIAKCHSNPEWTINSAAVRVSPDTVWISCFIGLDSAGFCFHLSAADIMTHTSVLSAAALKPWEDDDSIFTLFREKFMLQ